MEPLLRFYTRHRDAVEAAAGVAALVVTLITGLLAGAAFF